MTCHDVGPEPYHGPHAAELCTCVTVEQVMACLHCREDPAHQLTRFSVLRAVGFM